MRKHKITLKTPIIFRFWHLKKLKIKKNKRILIDMILDRENRIFPGEYEKNQINLFYNIQYNEQSIVL